jgi:hypothetical protein
MLLSCKLDVIEEYKARYVKELQMLAESPIALICKWTIDYDGGWG